MGLGPFFTGEQPSSPLLLTLNLGDDSSPDLTGYTAVEIVSAGLPSGTVSIVDAQAGTIQYAFTAPFAKPGRYTLQARLKRGTAIDYTAPAEFDVLATSIPAWIASDEVYQITGSAVSDKDIAVAARMVSYLVGGDVTASTFRDLYTDTDLGYIRQAVAWQAANIRKSETTGDDALNIPVGATSVSVDGLSVSFATPYGGTAEWDGIAKRWLSRLSTRVSTLYSNPLLGDGSGGYSQDERLWHPL